MNSIHREDLIFFLLRKGMHVNPVNKDTVSAFLMGYEIAARGQCGYREAVTDLLTKKHKLVYSNTGWIGQVEELAERQHDTWVNTLTRISLYVLTEQEEELSGETKAWIKQVVDARIFLAHSEQSSKDWIAYWNTLAFLKHKWIKKLWTPQQWKVIMQVDKLAKNNRVFEPNISTTPEMTALREQWNGMQDK